MGTTNDPDRHVQGMIDDENERMCAESTRVMQSDST